MYLDFSSQVLRWFIGILNCCFIVSSQRLLAMASGWHCRIISFMNNGVKEEVSKCTCHVTMYVCAYLHTFIGEFNKVFLNGYLALLSEWKTPQMWSFFPSFWRRNSNTSWLHFRLHGLPHSLPLLSLHKSYSSLRSLILTTECAIWQLNCPHRSSLEICKMAATWEMKGRDSGKPSEVKFQPSPKIQNPVQLRS